MVLEKRQSVSRQLSDLAVLLAVLLQCQGKILSHLQECCSFLWAFSASHDTVGSQATLLTHSRQQTSNPKTTWKRALLQHTFSHSPITVLLPCYPLQYSSAPPSPKTSSKDQITLYSSWQLPPAFLKEGSKNPQEYRQQDPYFSQQQQIKRNSGVTIGKLIYKHRKGKPIEPVGLGKLEVTQQAVALRISKSKDQAAGLFDESMYCVSAAALCDCTLMVSTMC